MAFFGAETLRVIRRPAFLPRQAENFFRAPPTALTPSVLSFTPDPFPQRRIRPAPAREPTFAFRAPAASGASPTSLWMENFAPPIRRARVRLPWLFDAIWIRPPPAPLPPAPLVIIQTIYAKTSSLYQPAFAPSFPFLGPSAQALRVGDPRGVSVLVKAGVTVSLIVDLSPTMGRSGLISEAIVQLLEAGGVDGLPAARLLGGPTVISAMGRRRQGIQQLLVNLMNGGEYVAVITVILADGSGHTFTAPFTVE